MIATSNEVANACVIIMLLYDVERMVFFGNYKQLKKIERIVVEHEWKW